MNKTINLRQCTARRTQSQPSVIKDAVFGLVSSAFIGVLASLLFAAIVVLMGG